MGEGDRAVLVYVGKILCDLTSNVTVFEAFMLN
jgi:hypothetical protein